MAYNLRAGHLDPQVNDFNLVAVLLVIAVSGRLFLAQVHPDCIRAYLSQRVAYRFLVVKLLAPE